MWARSPSRASTTPVISSASSPRRLRTATLAGSSIMQASSIGPSGATPAGCASYMSSIVRKSPA